MRKKTVFNAMMTVFITSIFALPLDAAFAETKSVTPNKAMAATSAADDLDYTANLNAWHESVEKSLRRDNGWLTLAGRFIMKEGVNTFGTGADNDIVFPSQLKDAGPSRLGTIVVDSAARTVTLKMVEGTTWLRDKMPIVGDTVLGSASDKRDWVSMDRIAMHVITRDSKYILRLADNKSLVRENFKGRIWYEPNTALRVQAKFIPYPAGRTIPIINVIDEVSDEPCPGYVEFTYKGVKQKLDVVGDDEGLFFVIRDTTAGKTTYRPSRFLHVQKRPEPNTTFTLDFNRAYNPPCAFSEFTTCPLPPKQNIMKFAIDAGEKYRKPL